MRVRPNIVTTWILHHDNAPSHTSAVREFLAQRNIPTLRHPSYSPDFTPCDFFLFPKIKTYLKYLKGHHLSTVQKIQSAVTRALNSLSHEDFLHCYEEWQLRWNHCVQAQGIYFEGDRVKLHIFLIKRFFENHSYYFWTTSYVYNVDSCSY